MTAPSLPEFLLARIAEDEAVAQALARQMNPIHPVHIGDAWDAEYPFAERFTAARVLAECEAKRRIVADLVEAGRDGSGRYEEGYGLTTAIQHLAAIYADHPDYREEWRP